MLCLGSLPGFWPVLEWVGGSPVWSWDCPKAPIAISRDELVLGSWEVGWSLC